MQAGETERALRDRWEQNALFAQDLDDDVFPTVYAGRMCAAFPCDVVYFERAVFRMWLGSPCVRSMAALMWEQLLAATDEGVHLRHRGSVEPYMVRHEHRTEGEPPIEGERPRESC